MLNDTKWCVSEICGIIIHKCHTNTFRFLNIMKCVSGLWFWFNTKHTATRFIQEKNRMMEPIVEVPCCFWRFGETSWNKKTRFKIAHRKPQLKYPIGPKFAGPYDPRSFRCVWTWGQNCQTSCNFPKTSYSVGTQTVSWDIKPSTSHYNCHK